MSTLRESLESKTEVLSGELSKEKQSRVVSETELSKLRAEKSDLSEDYKNQLEIQKKENETLKSMKDKLNGDFSKTMEELKKLREDKIPTKEETIDQLRQDLETERASVAEAYEQMEGIFAANQEIEEKDKQLIDKMENMNKAMEKIKADLFKAQERVREAEAQVKPIETPTSVSSDSETKFKEVNALNQQLRKTVTESEKLVAELKHEKNLLEGQVNSKETEQTMKEGLSVLDSQKLSQMLQKATLTHMGALKNSGIEGLSSSMMESGDTASLMKQLKYYRSKLKCPQCTNEDRNRLLRCGHTLCGGCIRENLEQRRRKCPSCGAKISEGEVRDLVLQS